MLCIIYSCVLTRAQTYELNVSLESLWDERQKSASSVAAHGPHKICTHHSMYCDCIGLINRYNPSFRRHRCLVDEGTRGDGGPRHRHHHHHRPRDPRERGRVARRRSSLVAMALFNRPVSPQKRRSNVSCAEITRADRSETEKRWKESGSRGYGGDGFHGDASRTGRQKSIRDGSSYGFPPRTLSNYSPARH